MAQPHLTPELPARWGNRHTPDYTSCKSHSVQVPGREPGVRLGGRVLARHAHGPEFHPQRWGKKKTERKQSEKIHTQIGTKLRGLGGAEEATGPSFPAHLFPTPVPPQHPPPRQAALTTDLRRCERHNLGASGQFFLGLQGCGTLCPWALPIFLPQHFWGYRRLKPACALPLSCTPSRSSSTFNRADLSIPDSPESPQERSDRAAEAGLCSRQLIRG